MAARKTHLNLTTFTVGGVASIASVKDATWRVQNASTNEKALAGRHAKHVLNKRQLLITASLMQQVGGAGQTNLDTSVYTVGGVDYLGDLKNGRLLIETIADEGSGQADEWTFPNATGTEITVEADQLILAAATVSLLNTAGGAKAGLNVTVAFTVGGAVYSCPMFMSAAEKRVEEDRIILLGLEFAQRGTPTLSGQTLLTLIATGTSVGTYSIDDSIDTVSGNCILMRAEMQFNDAGIVMDQFTFEGQGTPTFG